jgi:hypothetical protein
VLNSHYLSSNRSSRSAQLDDQDRQRDNQEQVDQDSTEMQTEAQKPQNQKSNENRPKHQEPRFRTRPPVHLGPLLLEALARRIIQTLANQN